MDFVKNFSEIRIDDIAIVGGKNASLGEMFNMLTPSGINIPDGFAVTTEGYYFFLDHNQIVSRLSTLLSQLDSETYSNLPEIGSGARTLLLEASFPKELSDAIIRAYEQLCERLGYTVSVAVRSSATAEDLPNASFAGQQETYLNVRGAEGLIKACQHCYASLFTNRAIKYRIDNEFEYGKVALSIGIQAMVHSDLASSGVMFTMDPDSGFENVVLISGGWGLGENVVRGSINTDEFMVFKPLMGKVNQPVISHKLGSKLKTMVYSKETEKEVLRPEAGVINLDTPLEKRMQFVLDDGEIIQLANWACIIQEHYKQHMDIEWAKDGENGKLYIVQARPETVHSHKNKDLFKQYTLQEKGNVICKGVGLGNRITSGKARILYSPSEIDKLQEGEILVTPRTDPDWDPILKKAAAIITDQGGRTSHAAIVAREIGTIAIVGTGNATQTIKDGQTITVSTAKGDDGAVYEGALKWTETAIDISMIQKPATKVMLILAHPDEAFRYSVLPNDGVGLMRMEFIISNAIGIHPMALRRFDELTDEMVKDKIAALTQHFADKAQYFIQKLAEATATIAAAFYPKDVIVRMSDFKTNEYAHLLGGKQFEPDEENPMIGFRGAFRYFHPLYMDGFKMECAAMKIVREEMGLKNVKLMIPFCRTITEAQNVIELMDTFGLKRGENGLELYLMIEIPSNSLQAEEFAKYFDGFSIGSNDLTQLTLGVDRDSDLLHEIFNPFDPAVMQLITMTLDKAKATGTHTGLCGQAPSDYPEYAQFLVEHGIDSISFNPDALVTGIENILQAENRFIAKK